MTTDVETDVLVVGGGIAGVSAAAMIARRRRVVLVEQEAQLAQHATGRSAAVFTETYGPPPIRALTRASRAALEAMGRDGPAVLTPRPVLWGAFDPAAVDALDERCAAEGGLRRLGRDEVRRLVPALRGDVVEGAVEAEACDIDALAVHQRYVNIARSLGVEVRRDAGVVGAEPGPGDRLTAVTPSGRITAEVVVDAAGAWADPVATTFGAAAAGLRPLRRTLAVARPSRPVDPDWPFVVDVAGRFYFKPEGPNVLVSPSDETPAEPGDARPDEIDVARALDAVNEVTDLDLRSVPQRWAGLRTFAPDGNPVVGHDPAVPGLFWLAGQGGYGIQTAPALAELAAALLLGDDVPAHLAAEGVDPHDLRPGPRP